MGGCSRCDFTMISFCLLFFNGLFKELDFKELEIHRYSLLDTIDEYQWISINEFIDGPSMNMVPFLWAPFFGPLGRLWAPWGPGRHGCGPVVTTIEKPGGPHTGCAPKAASFLWGSPWLRVRVFRLLGQAFRIFRALCCRLPMVV